MTPEELASATLRTQEIQAWITGLAIFIGPLLGVLFTLWAQGRKERNDSKHQLFLTLMAERKSILFSPLVVQALNKIDVVFASCPEVRGVWHQYYALLHQPPGEPRNHKWLELLSVMANQLGYKELSQIDIDKFYVPQGHVDDAEFQSTVARQWSRVLEATEHFVVKARDDNKA